MSATLNVNDILRQSIAEYEAQHIAPVAAAVEVPPVEQATDYLDDLLGTTAAEPHTDNIATAELPGNRVLQPNFEAIATKMIALGGHVHPVRMGEKALTVPGWQNLATRDLAVVAKWAAEDPHANCAVVGKADGLWLFDDDEGVLAEYEQVHGPIATYRVHSVSGGTHLYFRQNDASRAMGNLGGKNGAGKETWSARVNNRYVISAGSVAHPNNDPQQPLTQYRAVNPSVSATEAPQAFIDFLKAKASSTKADISDPAATGKVHEGGRNNYLFKKGCELRHIGAELPEIEAVLLRMNAEICEPELSESEVKTIAGSASRYEYRDSTVVNSAVPLVPADISTWRQQFRALGELEAGAVQMLIRGFLPEGTTFIGGLPGEGKTLLALSIVKALTTGKNFLGRADFAVPKPLPVLYLIPEVGARAFRTRCEKFHIPDNENLFLCRTISEGATLLLDDPMVLEAVRRMRPVVFLDTVLRFNEAEDENAAAQNKVLVNQLLELRHAGASIVGLHHSTKAMRKEGMSLEAVLRGTGDLAAMCDAVYGLIRDDKLYASGSGPNEIDIRCVKPRDFEPPVPFRLAASRKVGKSSIIGMAPGIVSNIDEYGDFVVVSGADNEQSNAERLAGLVQNDPSLTLSELRDMTGLSLWVIRQTLSKAGWMKGKGGSKGAGPWHSARASAKTDRGSVSPEGINLDENAA